MPSFVYEIDKNGNIVVTNEKCSAFMSETVSENQLYAVVSDIHVSNGDLTVMFRDFVNCVGTASGGLHAGEPIAGEPINWCELPSFDGDQSVASLKQEGSLARGVLPIGSTGSNTDPQAISSIGVQFIRNDSQALKYQPRKTYYSSGLAVEIRFSAPAASTI
jgi:hypothetical protein